MPSRDQILEALKIRCVEESFLELFSRGKLNGTVHTSVGQEFSAIAFAGQVEPTDFIFSSHRCHGHYLAYTKDYVGLIAELMGKKRGTCGGIGSSQHLQHGNFFSNGIQGGIMPVAAGYALAYKLAGNGRIGIVFIGDGTLGEGVVYETLNLISLWRLPLLVVCENNHFAQSTRIQDSLAGDIRKRAEAFSIPTFVSSTSDVDALLEDARASIDVVRTSGSAVFHLVDTNRLNAHSKGDDTRDPKEIARYREQDFFFQLEKKNPELFGDLRAKARQHAAAIVEELLDGEETSAEDYLLTVQAQPPVHEWQPLESHTERQVTLINRAMRTFLAVDKKHVFIGEDVLSPYSGAFKVARDLSFQFPDQVFSTPISEAAITGIGNGLALAGCRPVIEIMFGDFVTLALDQIINHASKFFHMYNRQVTCPLVLRTPMGGRRGYGPTHSQSLDRLLIGLDNVTVVALNTLVNPELIYHSVFSSDHPVIVIENKTDYGKVVAAPELPNYQAEVSKQPFPVVRIHPVSSVPTLSIVTYGGMSSIVLDVVMELFQKCDIKSEVLVLSCISPVNYSSILESVARTKRLVVVEEGSVVSGIGSEIVSVVVERADTPVASLKIGAHPVPVPSVRSLEDVVLPSRGAIVSAIAKRFS